MNFINMSKHLPDNHCFVTADIQSEDSGWSASGTFVPFGSAGGGFSGSDFGGSGFNGMRKAGLQVVHTLNDEMTISEKSKLDLVCRLV